jgi:DNA-binding NarL/FixJ family response regulator
VRVERRDAALTGRERSIAELVALGESNSQVAQRLGISVKTVEKHVSSIFAKLGMRNRAQIAALFAPQSVAP